MWYKSNPASVFLLFLSLSSLTACKRKSTARTAFYSWRTSLQLDQHQSSLLRNPASNRLYLRVFDVTWKDELSGAVPDALISIRESMEGIHITPVIYLTNIAIQHTVPDSADVLARKVNRLLERMMQDRNIRYSSIQVDCDWTQHTRPVYFAFLRSLKKYSHKQTEATIRLHQVKYPERTGIPPVDRGLLMFYNMGKISADLNAGNSIYNSQDAARYLDALPQYRLALDVALPLFSWSIQIRNGKVIQLHGRIGRQDLLDTAHFKSLRQQGVFLATRSFYLHGNYIRENDLMKLEEIDQALLRSAARQLAPHLAPLENRNIIYYEISAHSLKTIEPQDLEEISAYF